MRKTTKIKCKYYIICDNNCNYLIHKSNCIGDRCWLIKNKLNTKEKAETIKKLNEKMKEENYEI